MSNLQFYPPKTDHHFLWVVAEQVARFLDAKGVHSHKAAELFGEGQLCLSQILVAHLARVYGVRVTEAVDAIRAGKICPEQTLSEHPPSIPYIRTSVANAIRKASQRYPQLAIPPSTRWDRKKRGDDTGDLVQKSWDDVFGRDTEYGTVGLLAHCPPHWHDAEQQWFSPQSDACEWLEIIECYEVLYSLCRDDLDRAILESRWDNGRSLELGPVSITDVAKIVGLSPRTVQSRLNDMERRYYKQANRRLPTAKRTNR